MACYAQKECGLEEKIARWVSSLDLSHLEIPLSFLSKPYQCLPKQKEAPELYAEGVTKEEDLKRVVLDKILLAQWEGELALF